MRSLLVPAVLVGGVAGYLFFELAPGFLAGGAATQIATSAASGEAAVEGRASVIDGDTLDIRGSRIRLHGVDAPEASQTCLADGMKWRCGHQAALALSDRIGSSTVSCEKRDVDRYGRVVAVCRAQGADLNAWLVERGWALAYRRYSTDYVDEEEIAAAVRRGLWKGSFVPPWDWRRGQRLQTEEAGQSGDCAIKGNISSGGERIYHVPGGEYYSRTKISPSKGERWFCSEAEARAAGWRRSKR